MARRFAALIRHGAYHQRPGAPSAHQPFDLTEEGMAQARAACAAVTTLAAALDARIAPTVDCSNMLRAWRTARVLADGLAGTFEIDCFDALAERGVGAAANLSVEEIDRIVAADPRFDPLPPGWKSDSHFRLPFQGAETLLESGDRVAAHVAARLASSLADDNAIHLFVGHGASFRHAAYRLGVLAFDDIKRLSMFHAAPVVLERIADGTWRHVAGEWKRRTETDAPLD